MFSVVKDNLLNLAMIPAPQLIIFKPSVNTNANNSPQLHWE